MALKVIKAIQDVGKANDEGLSFAEPELLRATRKAYDAAQARARRDGGVTTGPARVRILIEQEVILDGD